MCRLAVEQGVSGWSVQQILHEAKFKHYIPKLTHGLLEDGPDCRLQFCELMLNKLDKDPHKIIWTDEANFKLSGHVNRHICSYWCTENPNITMETQLNQPGVSVWGGLFSFGVFGLYCFEGTVTGEKYLDMLQIYVVLGL
jgi:hypothetical protein